MPPHSVPEQFLPSLCPAAEPCSESHGREQPGLGWRSCRELGCPVALARCQASMTESWNHQVWKRLPKSLNASFDQSPLCQLSATEQAPSHPWFSLSSFLLFQLLLFQFFNCSKISLKTQSLNSGNFLDTQFLHGCGKALQVIKVGSWAPFKAILATSVVTYHWKAWTKAMARGSSCFHSHKM